MVKAKLYVQNVSISAINEDGSAKSGGVKLSAVCRGDANKRWASATPFANFDMNINGSALEWFKARVGKELSITMDDAGSDPATHEFSPLEEELVPEYERGRPDRVVTCAECGHPEEAHR